MLTGRLLYPARVVNQSDEETLMYRKEAVRRGIHVLKLIDPTRERLAGVHASGKRD